MDEVKDKDEKNSNSTKKHEKRKETVTPTPKHLGLFNFLQAEFWAESCPDKIVLTACYGAAGKRLGPVVREMAFKPGEKPTTEKIIELCNLLLGLAQADCDALAKSTKYAVCAYDLARSDRAIGRCLVALQPSGATTALADERYGGVFDDDDEGNGLSTKLLLGLLESERRDKRWTMELAMHTISGAIEQQTERIERMETIVDGSWMKQAEMMKATEAMLSQAADRQIKLDWMKWKRERLTQLADKGMALAGVVLPELVRSKSPTMAAAIAGAATSDNPIIKFLATVTEEQGSKAFGTWTSDGTRLTEGVFDTRQLHLFRSLSEQIDDKLVAELIESITPEQIASAREIFDLGQLVPLVTWMQTRHANDASANGASTNGAVS